MKTTKIFAAFVSAAMLLTVCSCGAKPSEQSKATPAAAGPITLTFFDKNTGDAFTNPVARYITEKTGVTVEIQQPTGNPEEKLSLMLAGGDLPDIVLMDRRSTMLNKYIAAGALKPLDDLIDQYGADVKAMYGDVIDKSRYEDGKCYYLNNWYAIDPNPDRGINIRMDYLKEFGYGEKAEKGEAFTQAEFSDMLKKFKDGYGGEGAAIPFTMNGAYMETVLSTFKGMYGMKNYYEPTAGNIQLYVRDPKYVEMMKYLNKLYRDGLLDKEWATNNEDLLKQKLLSGRVMAANGGMPTEVNAVLEGEKGGDSQFFMFKVIAGGVNPNETTFSPRSSLGWDAIGITTSNKHPEETMKFINFLASEEGQYLLMWGLEGVNWNMENGKHVPKPEVFDGFKNDWGGYSKETGIRKWSWFIKNGYGSDGTPYDVVTKYNEDKVTAAARKAMEGSVWDTAVYDNLGPAGGTPDALNEQKLNDIIDQGFAKMAFAESEDQVVAEYARTLARLEAGNAPGIEAIYTANYKKRLAVFN